MKNIKLLSRNVAEYVVWIKCRWFCLDIDLLKHVEADWRICALVNKATIGPDNGLSPDRRQAIIRANAGIFFDWTIRNKLQGNFNRNSYIFIQANAFENIVCINYRQFCLNIVVLTHWGLMTPYGDKDLGHHWLR